MGEDSEPQSSAEVSYEENTVHQSDTLEESSGDECYKNYATQCEYVLSLPRIKPDYGRDRKARGLWPWQRFLALGIAKRFLLCSVKIPLEYLSASKYIYKTYRLRNTKISRRAIVIGNGPSQGSLSADFLNRFQADGGDTIAVNYWHLNKRLRNHIPTMIVLSDPSTFEGEKGRSLVEYLRAHPGISLVTPTSKFASVLNDLGLESRTSKFIDIEARFMRSISPCCPRGYLSMTLYKALAWAVHLGYSKIGVIGMDNTYPRNVFCDENNNVLNHEIHAGISDYVLDQSELYPNVAALLHSLYKLFKDLELFPNTNVFNLDKYSLTDRFRKVEIDDFSESLG